jgi:cytochrome c-type biogenesis protein CcmH/NrfG
MITIVITVLSVLVFLLSVVSITLGIQHARTRQVCDRLNLELAQALREAQHQQTVHQGRIHLHRLA